MTGTARSSFRAYLGARKPVGIRDQPIRLGPEGLYPLDVLLVREAGRTGELECDNPKVLTQIYGITSPDHAKMVNAFAPDNVGVVLDEEFHTWDGVDEAAIRAIVSELTDVTVVALSLATEANHILRTVKTVQPGVDHLVRAAEMPLGLLASLRKELRLSETADYLLLHSALPQTGQVGATGLVNDWTLSRGIVESCSAPCILAGGLGPANVREPIEAVGPYGVDSETNTSQKDDHRRKDPEKVRLFIERARSQTS
jgi:phosphoribosylanthranilate isomerase